VRRLRTRGKYLRIKKDTHELPCDTLTLLPEEPKSAGSIKEENRGEGEFRAPDKKSRERLGISPGPDSSIISLISSFKIF
jgi:hypothetical protein